MAHYLRHDFERAEVGSPSREPLLTLDKEVSWIRSNEKPACRRAVWQFDDRQPNMRYRRGETVVVDENSTLRPLNHYKRDGVT